MVYSNQVLMKTLTSQMILKTFRPEDSDLTIRLLGQIKR